ncbi:MAG TPA: AAA family ATPase [Spirochaetia bacterium]|nr:AAA family ATPase [Spirochaetia bacterium]
MRVLDVQIENWRGLRKASFTFSSRITILHGPNEAGKSTVQEAIRFAFLGEASSSATELKELVPWGSSAKAHVGLIFATGAGERLRIEKSFPKGEARLYQLDAGGSRDGGALLAEGRAVQDKIYEYLGIPSDALDLLSVLWIDQGDALSLFGKRPDDSALRGPAQTLIKSVIKENLLSGPVEELYRELQVEQGELFQKSGRPRKGSRLAELEQREAELAAETAAQDEEIAATANSSRELSEIDELITGLASEESAERELLARLEVKQEAAARLEPKLAALGRLEESHQNLLGIEVREERAAGRIPSLVARKAEALEESKRLIDEQTARATELRAKLAKRVRAVESAPVTDRRILETLDASLRRIREGELRLEASGLAISVTPGSGATLNLRLSLDGGSDEAVELRERGEWQAARKLRVTLLDGTEIECAGPLSEGEWGRLTEEMEAARSELARQLEELGLADLEQAKSAYDSFLAEETERARIAAELAAIGGSHGRGLESQMRSLERSEEELRAEREELDALGIVPSSPGRTGSESTPGEGADAAEHLSRVSRELTIAMQELRECRRQRSELLGARTREAFARERLGLKEEVEREATAIAEMEPREPASVGIGEIKKERDRIEGLSERANVASHRRTALQTMLSRSSGLLEGRERKERELQRVRRELEDERRRCGAISLLLELMDEEREELDRNIVEPLKDRLSEAFKAVVGERYSGVEISDQLGIGDISISALAGGTGVGNSALSYGTREQLSFLFRLLLAQYLSTREPQIMMLDDTFVNTDNSRRDRLFQMMIGDSSGLQFLLFTCHADHYADYQGTDGVEMIEVAGA